MRRFFRGQRDEDYGQIQYLTAKCTRLARDKAVSDREVLLFREKEKKLQNDLQAVAAQLFHLEKSNMELRRTQDQLIGTIHQQQELVELLQQRVIILAGESERDAELLRQVCSELLCLQSSEVRLEGLVEELHLRAHGGDEQNEGLQAELQIKTAELEQLRDANKMLAEELMDLRFTHEEQVRALRRENDGGARKLQETLEQFEWLCHQQRSWMARVKSFKDHILKEREGLLQQVHTQENQAKQWKKSRDHVRRHCPLEDHDCCNRSSPSSWDTKEVRYEERHEQRERQSCWRNRDWWRENARM
ncbi:cerebellar degeneration-related protein 2-like isoform X3 [Hippocampus comes]|uniref:cerebellar degeneration-related protein 2-like isoform X3 n=1 Tax=Hippocampus comes TaxID=109280 RepID=UPI00094F29C7|nr:PREDICTED: cerebellar degeneration-related protein 2-like isoform X3 [Hippocampus comes]